MNPQQYPGGIISPQNKNETPAAQGLAATVSALAVTPPAAPQPTPKPVQAYATKGGVVLDSHAPKKRSLVRTYMVAAIGLLAFGSIGSYLLFTSHADTLSYTNGDIYYYNTSYGSPENGQTYTSINHTGCAALAWSWTGNESACAMTRDSSPTGAIVSTGIDVFTSAGVKRTLTNDVNAYQYNIAWSKNPATADTPQFILRQLQQRSGADLSSSITTYLQTINTQTGAIQNLADSTQKNDIYDAAGYGFGSSIQSGGVVPDNLDWSADNSQILYTILRTKMIIPGSKYQQQYYLCHYSIATKEKACAIDRPISLDTSTSNGPITYSINGMKWSPDGSQFTYSYKGKLHVVNSDGTDDAVVGTFLLRYSSDTTGRYAVYNTPPVNWTADGKNLLYNICEKSTGGCASATMYQLQLSDRTVRQLFPMSGSGSRIVQRPLSRLTKAIQQPANPSPYVARPNGDVYFSTVYYSNRVIAANDVYGNNFRYITTPVAQSGTITTDVHPIVSPDGRSIAFLRSTSPTGISSSDNAYSVYVANIDGTNLRKMTLPAGFEQQSLSVVWSPDSSRIATAAKKIVNGTTDRYEGFVMIADIANGLLNPIAQTPSYSSYISELYGWSNENYIFYNGSGLCRIGIDGTNQRCSNNTNNLVLGFSSDATLIAYRGRTQVNGQTSDDGTVHIQKADGTGDTVILNQPNLNIESVNWSGDGKRLLLTALAKGGSESQLHYQYYTANADGSQLKQLSNVLRGIPAFDVTWANAVTSGYTAVNSVRVTDTRAGSGQINANRTLAAGSSLDIPVSGVNGLPANGIDAVVANITEASSTAPGYLTVSATGSARPTTSSVNFSTGLIANNQTTVKVGSGGKISVYNGSSGRTDVIVDIVGYYSANGNGYTPITPTRATDTRSGSGQANAGQKAGLSSPVTVKLSGVGGVPANATAAVVNATVITPGGSGYLTLYPTGQAAPNISSLNFYAGNILSKEATVKIGSNGSINVQAHGTATDVVVDVVGYYTAEGGSRFVPLTPIRIADTRNGSNQPYSGRHLTTSSPLTVNAFGLPATYLPSTATGLVTNLTVAVGSVNGYVTTYPGGASRPNTSSLNFPANAITFNQNTTALGASGSYTLAANNGTVDVIVDLQGYFTR